MNIFEEATKLKLRFKSSAGFLSTEDLWDLPLKGKRVDLDGVARIIAKAIQEEEMGSFVEKTKKNTTETLKLNLVKSIIASKLADKAKKEQDRLDAERKKLLLKALNEKQVDQIKGKSIAELQAEIDQLKQSS